MIKILTIDSTSKRQVIDISQLLENELSGSGLLNVFTSHTTTAILTANLDPHTDQDLLDAIEKMTPNLNWQHPHDPSHFPDHLWSSIIGTNLTIPFQNGKLQLGMWQHVVFMELDGPRQRQVNVTVISA